MKIGSVLPPAARRPAPAPTPAEVEELKRWGNEDRVSRGVLLTPPIGRPREKTRRVQQYLEALVQRLAGDRLREENLQLRLNLYSSDAINAFMRGREYDKPDPLIRRMVHHDPDGSPVYELGVNLGTLRQLRSEDELAFVLGHELTHLLEHHSDPTKPLDERSKSWLSSQSHEAVADYRGLEMMVNAGYNPEAALVLLNRLYGSSHPNGGQDELMRGLEQGVEAHHHEGVRVSLAQARVEQLRRTDPRARPGTPFKPMPAFLQLERASRTDARHENLDQFRKSLETVTEKYLLGPEPAPWLGRHFGFEGEDPDEVKTLRSFGAPFRAEGEQLFGSAFKLIRHSGATPQLKGNAVLRLLHYLVQANNRADLELKPQTVGEVADFLRQQTEQGWTLASFLRSSPADG